MRRAKAARKRPVSEAVRKRPVPEYTDPREDPEVQAALQAARRRWTAQDAVAADAADAAAAADAGGGGSVELEAGLEELDDGELGERRLELGELGELVLDFLVSGLLWVLGFSRGVIGPVHGARRHKNGHQPWPGPHIPQKVLKSAPSCRR